VDAALVASAALMGLAGAPHCAAMCGAAYGAIGGAARAPGAAAAAAFPQAAGAGGSPAPSLPRRASVVSPAALALQVGRAAGYASAGAVVALGVGHLATLGLAAPVLRPLWAMLHVAAIVLGGWLVLKGRVPAWIALPRAVRAADAQPLRFVRRLPASTRAGVIGVCWAAMPCGLLQSALLVAALASGPAAGAGVMLAFALASAPGLWLGPLLWQRLAHARSATAAAGSVRLAGGLLAVASGFALWHGLGEAITQALCAT
jgi:sulfite exporter TauE/SafE